MAWGSTQSPRLKAVLSVLLAAIAVLGASFASAARASAAETPEWAITSYAAPTDLPPGGAGELLVTAVNVGGAATNGSAVTIKDTLPAGLSATSITSVDVYASGPVALFGVELSCELTPEIACTTSSAVQPGDQLVVKIHVEVEAGAPASVTNHAVVSGGGAPAGASIDSPVTISSKPASFGLAQGSVIAALSSHRAGAHANVTTGFAMNTTGPVESAGDPKDVSFNLPPGAVGNTVGVPRCTSALAIRKDCPSDTIVGVATVRYQFSSFSVTAMFPVFNIAPAPGEPAAFMFQIGTSPVRLDTSVLSNGNYGVRVTAGNITQNQPVLSSYVTIWGVPADHQGPGAVPIFWDETAGVERVGAPLSGATRVPLLSNPTQCSKPLSAVVETDAWRNPGVFQQTEASVGSLTGCLEVPFSSSFSLLPDTLEAGAPAGYRFDLSVPQQATPDQSSASDVRSVSLTLPEGVVVNPSAAWGLKACTAEAFYGPGHPSQAPAAVAKCPREAQVGTVWIKTPALEEALEGQVYLAEPECRPCTPQDAEDGKMVRLYVQAVSEGEGGIVVKLEGHANVNQLTGQITSIFEENPQLPFDEFKLKLEGGPRAVLANPRKCGTVTASGDLQPWSNQLAESETATVGDSTPTYAFEIDQNCFGSQFAPSFKAGMPNVQAGARGEFTLAFGREDSSEYLNGISLKLPEGLLGSLVGIPLCKEAEANAGTCSAASELGSVEALTGPGANPFLVSGGHVYLTEGYGGSPYGLSIVVPAVAGPYTLAGTTGNGTVVVRSQIFVDPHTAQLTVVSGQLPSMLDGIPLQLKAVSVRIDRPGFMFNPTSCQKMAVTGALTAVEGLSASVSSPFQVTNCAALPFKPGFTASTKAGHTRKGGAYLQVNVSSGEGQADIAKAKVELPKKLPSRLSTLQQACTEAQFDSNPAGCPAASQVGSVVVHTPVLPVPLTGPAYFVSRGAQWPELIMVLQGYGVTVDLAGETHISKGITSTTLNAVPDVPFTSFTLTLPEGSHSALAGNGNLCKEQLVMPVTLTGQNGALVEQSTKVKVTGCQATTKKKKTKKKTKAKAKRKAGKHSKAIAQRRAGTRRHG
ncbi:MAG TPA: hypothetical protein VGF95_01500 [Solirubrobacteraceae bacterium]